MALQRILLWLIFVSPLAGGQARFVGSSVCAGCHKEIAARQAQTPMANTWQGRVPTWLPAAFDARIEEDLAYRVQWRAAALTYSVTMPDRPADTLPVEVSMGGRRHGLGFLVPIQEVDGIPLARRAVVQARYAWSPEQNKLLLAPGCVRARPQSMEDALGQVLSPTFESRCLSCHGQPDAVVGRQEGGVHCESCHGPGSEHLRARRNGIINPRKLSVDENIAICASCHVGLTRFSDPSPDDLLVANQVRAMQSSECFLQSRNGFSCTSCHDPHGDTSADDRRAVSTCLGCHSTGVKEHAAICPVNAKTACVGCHMPSVEMGPLHLVDHLIRVHPEQKIHTTEHNIDLRTQIRPISEYLRMITANSAEAAAGALERVQKGESFYQVARETSADRTASIGGYLGRKGLAQLDNGLSDTAAQLGYGQTSPAIQIGKSWIILQRLPRDFRWDAEQVQLQAEQLAARGDAAGAIAKAQEALKIYPHFLRSLRFIAITFAQSGNPQKAADVLATAIRLYPQDASLEFSLGSARSLLNDPVAATAAFKQAIALESDVTAAYERLGTIFYTAGDWQAAINTFRQGLQIDPMSAQLYDDLGLALEKSGDVAEAEQAKTLASKLQPSQH